MKFIKISIVAALLAGITACEEFQPVFTGTYDDPEYVEPVDMKNQVNTTIAQIKDMYTANKGPVTLHGNIMIGGQVTTSDKVGNVYKSLYIQDETAGIEIKIGKNALYNEYKLGQWIYVLCDGLTVGDYNGMIQIGYSDPTGEYETSYMEHQYIIDNHVFKGEYGEPVQPRVIAEADLKKKENLGRLVTIKDLKYDNAIFLLIYVNPNLSGEAKKAATNRIFIDEEGPQRLPGDPEDLVLPKNWGVDTWAMSETLFKKYLEAGNFDRAELQDGSKKVSDYKNEDGSYSIIPTAYSVSQYFKMGSKAVQVRSSGYARFSDEKIDADVVAGKKKIDFTGILTEYQGSPQFTLIDLTGVNVHD